MAGDTRPPGGHQPGQPAAPVQSHLMTHSNLHVAFFFTVFKENVILKKKHSNERPAVLEHRLKGCDLRGCPCYKTDLKLLNELVC